MGLTNAYLWLLTEASRKEDDERKRRQREAEAQDLEAEAEENNAENEAEAEDSGETEEEELPPDELPPEDAEAEEAPQEEEEDPLGDVGDFSMEPEVPDPDDGAEDGEAPPEGEDGGGEGQGEGEGGDDMSDVPAPDGLPEADDDGSGDQEAPQEEAAPEDQTVQTVILKMSKLDRQLGKLAMYDMLCDLRASIRSVLTVVDKNETVIDASVRETYIKDLNDTLGELETYIKHKFKKTGLEDSIVNYFEIVQKVSGIVSRVQDGLAASRNKKAKHNNNEGMYGPASDM